MERLYWVLKIKVDNWTVDDYTFFNYWLGLCPKNMIEFRRALAHILMTEAFHVLHDNMECVPLYVEDDALLVIIPTTARPDTREQRSFHFGGTDLGFKRTKFYIETADDNNNSFKSNTIRDHTDYGKVMQAYKDFRNVQLVHPLHDISPMRTKRSYDDINV